MLDKVLQKGFEGLRPDDFEDQIALESIKVSDGRGQAAAAARP